MTSTYELTLNSVEYLTNKVKKFPEDAPIHLTDKQHAVSNLEIIKHLPHKKLRITFSLANHYHAGDLSLIEKDLNNYIDTIKVNNNIEELLIVSGSNTRKFDTLSVLKYLQNNLLNANDTKNIVFSVAYNCNAINQDIENQRLITKLSYKLVQKVYIQITDNIEKILESVYFIKSLDPKIKVCVCIFEANKLSLSKFKFRPWKGVILSKKFLSSFENAYEINKFNLKQLEQLNIETIITI